eukprot:jgi/Psemu1/309993/fgenesh1_kg.576_\
MRHYTRQFILSHMIKGNYYQAKVIAINEQDGSKQSLIKSELGTHMWITSTEDMVRFQSQELLLPDQPTEHGYVEFSFDRKCDAQHRLSLALSLRVCARNAMNTNPLYFLLFGS